MANINQGLQLIIGIIAIIGLLAALAVITRGAFSKAQIEALREDNNDLRAGRSDDRARLDLLEKDVERLTSENLLLKGLVTQRAQVEDLTKLLTHHHEESMDSLSNLSMEFASMAKAIGAKK